jgi:hypothetical protein
MKLIAWLGAWMLFWTGHICSNITFLNFAYQWLMGTSLKIQDWGKINSPWRYPEEGEI